MLFYSIYFNNSFRNLSTKKEKEKKKRVLGILQILLHWTYKLICHWSSSNNQNINLLGSWNSPFTFIVILTYKFYVVKIIVPEKLLNTSKIWWCCSLLYSHSWGIPHIILISKIYIKCESCEHYFTIFQKYQIITHIIFSIFLLLIFEMAKYLYLLTFLLVENWNLCAK